MKGCALGGCAFPFGIFALLLVLTLIFESGYTPLIIVLPCILAIIGAPIGLVLGGIFATRRKTSKDTERDPKKHFDL